MAIPKELEEAQSDVSKIVDLVGEADFDDIREQLSELESLNAELDSSVIAGILKQIEKGIDKLEARLAKIQELAGDVDSNVTWLADGVEWGDGE